MDDQTIDLFIKLVWIPAVGIIGWLSKSKIEALEQSNKDLEDKVDELDRTLAKNYYDKEEIKEHIVDPIVKDIREITAEVKHLSGMMNEIHQDMAIMKYKILGEELKNQ